MLFADDRKRILESLLFVACEPLSVKRLAEISQTDEAGVKELLFELQEEYAEKGFHLKEIAGGWQFFTDEAYAPYIEKLYRPRMQQLSKASLETLAIIAYRQPITRGEIELIRGVNADSIVSRLLEKDLIMEVGRKEAPGKPILYGTTNAFLAFFGLNSLEDLPAAQELPQEETRDFYRHRLPQEKEEKGKTT